MNKSIENCSNMLVSCMVTCGNMLPKKFCYSIWRHYSLDTYHMMQDKGWTLEYHKILCYFFIEPVILKEIYFWSNLCSPVIFHSHAFSFHHHFNSFMHCLNYFVNLYCRIFQNGFLTRIENCSKVSFLILFSNASFFNSLLIQLKKYSHFAFCPLISVPTHFIVIVVVVVTVVVVVVVDTEISP